MSINYKNFSFGVLLVLACLNAGSQNLTGTWLACYQQDFPGKRQLFFFRFFLQQTGSQLKGFGQTFPAGVLPAQMKAPALQYALKGRVEEGLSTFQLEASNHNPVPIEAPLPFIPSFQCTPTNSTIEELSLRAPGLWAPALDPGGLLAGVELVRISDSLPAAVRKELANDRADVSLGKTIKSGRKKTFRSTQEHTVSSVPAQRLEEVQGRLRLPEDFVVLSLYDNGTIDNDTVSLMLNGTTIVSRERLTQFPVQRVVNLDRRKENKLVLVAHNEGMIPPNTALLIVESGGVRKQAHLGSTLLKNGVLLISIQKEEMIVPAFPNGSGGK